MKSSPAATSDMKHHLPSVNPSSTSSMAMVTASPATATAATAVATVGTTAVAAAATAAVVSHKKLRIKVCVRDKLFDVVCGDGSQQIKWLANVALARYDSTNGFEFGAPQAVRLEDGQQLDWNKSIRDQLKHDQQVFVVLRKGKHTIRAARIRP